MKHEKIIEETIDTIDNLEQAQISPYFKARMNAILNSQREAEYTHGLQPLALLTFSIVLLLINTLLISKSVSKDTSNNNNKTTIQQQFSEDYNINNSSNYYYDDKQ
jgi:hypothetical protein